MNCRNLTSDVMDFAIAITYALQPHLHNTDFIWDSVFVGLDVGEKHLRKLPCKGYALMLLLGEFSDITFSTGNCSSSISLPGDMLMFRPSEVKCTNFGSGGCFAIVLYESGTRDDHRPIDTLRQKSLAERWRENEDLEELMTVDCGPYDPNDPAYFKGPLPHLQAEYTKGPSPYSQRLPVFEITSDVCYPSVPSVANGRGGHYNLVQACCEKSNHLHKRPKINKECHFIDITIDDDFTTPKGRKMAIDGLRGPSDTIFFTGPCTGGSKWTQYNAKRGGKTLAKIERRREVFWTLWDYFHIVAKHAVRVGARILIELPRGCSYWHDPRMIEFLVKHGFNYADFDGCMYGLVARHGPEMGHPINKPWRIACLNSSLGSFLDRLCNKGHDLPHTRCGGQNTIETQAYTPRIADIIRRSLRNDVRALKHVNGSQSTCSPRL